jgi:methionine sulfoxide reductase heme-binding subunit
MASVGQMESRKRWLRRYGVRILANLLALVALAMLAWGLAAGRFFIDPVKEITIRTGRLAVAFLLLSLACTPIFTLTGFGRILQARRPLGLWSMVFAALHFLAFAGWDYRFDPALLRIGIFAQPFIIVGLAAFLLLLVLGVTSIPALRGTMGRTWPWVQRLAYVAAGLSVWHIIWVKKNPLEAWEYPVILAGLLLLRIPLVKRTIVRVRKSLRLSTGGA